MPNSRLGAVGVRVPLYRRHSWWKAEPIPQASNSQPYGNFLHHNLGALTTRLWLLSIYNFLLQNFKQGFCRILCLACQLDVIKQRKSWKFYKSLHSWRQHNDTIAEDNYNDTGKVIPVLLLLVTEGIKKYFFQVISYWEIKDLGPVVQSIISLISSLLRGQLVKYYFITL